MSKINSIRNFTPVTIELDKERELKFDMNAFALLEDKYGSVDSAMDKMMEGSMKDIKNVLWAGLVHDEVKEFDEDTGEPIKYNITPYQVGSWVSNTGMLAEVTKKLTEAMAQGMPEDVLKQAEQDAKAVQPAPKNM